MGIRFSEKNFFYRNREIQLQLNYFFNGQSHCFLKLNFFRQSSIMKLDET